MKTTTLNKRVFFVAAALTACFSLVGCVVVEDDGYDHDYRTQQQKDDDMAEDALHDSMKGLTKKEKRELKNLGK